MNFRDEVRVEYDRASRTYTIYCPADIRDAPRAYKISEAKIIGWAANRDKEEYYDSKTGMNHWDLVKHIIDRHLLPTRRREAIKHTRRLGLS